MQARSISMVALIGLQASVSFCAGNAPGVIATCKRPPSIQFEVQLFPPTLSKCEPIRDGLRAEVRSLLDNAGLKVVEPYDASMSMLMIRVDGSYGPEFGQFFTDVRVSEDLQVIRDGVACRQRVLTWSNHPQMQVFPLAGCDAIKYRVLQDVSRFIEGT